MKRTILGAGNATEGCWPVSNDSPYRANKFFFGAPFLDGVRPSIFLVRGIYTRIKMCALDVDPATHRLTERWEDNKGWDSPWFGQEGRFPAPRYHRNHHLRHPPFIP